MMGDETGQKGGAMDELAVNRIVDLEYTIVKARDSLRVVCRALSDFTETNTVDAMDEADSAMVFGTVAILEGIVKSCDRAIGVK